MDTSSEEFKNMIKLMNLRSRTEMEKHEDNREEFKKLMPILRNLDEEETEIFFHLLENRDRSDNASH